jgi:two-component system sensor histidine kinase DegS
LDTLGLVAAVRRHAHSRLQPLNINVTVEVKGKEMRFPSDVETALFRVVQGTIGNIVEHSKAKNASIVLVYQPDEFSLSISDDGQGFDVSKI